MYKKTFYDNLKVRCIKDITYKDNFGHDIVYKKNNIYRANVSFEKFITIFRVFRGKTWPLCLKFNEIEFKKYFTFKKRYKLVNKGGDTR